MTARADLPLPSCPRVAGIHAAAASHEWMPVPSTGMTEEGVPFDTLLVDCRAATMVAGGVAYGAIEAAAVGIRDGRIAWIGPEADLPDDAASAHTDVQRLGGRWVTPGLIDCHTHLVFAGDRVGEFEARLNGATYQEIAAAGGGILSTVRATRAASLDQLIESAADRLESLKRDGVTTVEIKSGYGLDRETELKMLRAARALEGRGVRVTTTYLGLHALPPAFAGRADAYVDHVIADILPAVVAERLADAVDAYVEPIAFTPEQAERFFAAAAEHGLPAKLHAEQFSDSGGARLATRIRALSADHLEYADEAAVVAMAEAGVAAVLLPGAYVALRETRPPPVDALRRHAVAMAVATDCNPGTSPLTSLLAAMNLGCALWRLTPEEALAGTTRAAAQALGLAADRGTLEAGKRADLAVWDVSTPAELSYWLGRSRLWRRYLGGVVS